MGDQSDIIGYVDPLISSPGDKVAVKISTSQPTFTSEVFRLSAGYEHKDAPAIAHQRIQAIPRQSHKGTPQYSRIGSFAKVNKWKGDVLDNVDSFTISFWCRPTLLAAAKHDQYLFSSLEPGSTSGFECLLIHDGHPTLRVQSDSGIVEITFNIKLAQHHWNLLSFVIYPRQSVSELSVRVEANDIGERTLDRYSDFRSTGLRFASHSPLFIASDSLGCKASGSPISSATFNGKIDGFEIETTSNGSIDTLLDLDFSLGIPTSEVRDKSKYKHHGELFNAPSRAVTGHDWDASQTDWTRASYGYGAIQFHDDDLDDAAWDTSFELELPRDFRSGCYGVFVDDGESTDYIPFFVRPDPNAEQVPPVALIIPTFTYAAYANEHLHDETRTVHFPGDTENLDKHFRTLMKRPDLGISLYDSHNNGSGTVSSSLKRPVLNMRPSYRMWLFNGPREFPADLWFIAFLDRLLGTPTPSNPTYDIITDHDISAHGASLLTKYKLLISCSHPEYPTSHMLDAYAAFLARGGSFMYLGGNGYYWSTTHSPTTSPHRIEVRRAEAGCRTFSLPPGEHHHSNGEPGGLWRSRGRPPNQLFGIGSCAMGVGKGCGYGITKEAREDPRLVNILKGLEDVDVFGEEGLVNGAASGDEIDRADFGLGTPRNAVVLATTKLAGGHSDQYMLFNEETLFPMVDLKGTESEKVRSDVVYFEMAGGGKVFSVGSINWIGAMAWRDFDNDVARLTGNVLREFLGRGDGGDGKVGGGEEGMVEGMVEG